MTYIPPTRNTIKSRLSAYFESAGFISLEAGTPENALLNILTDNIFTIYQDLTTSYITSLPLNSTGAALDSWSQFFGIERSLSTVASDATTNNVHFFVRDSGNLNGNLNIPEGTLVSDGNSKIYKTTASVDIPSTTPNIVFVAVEALTSGASNNVEAAELTTHNLDYDYVEVSNRFPIIGGTDTALDTDVQLSLQSLFGKRIGTNLESIVEQISSLPGVSQASLFNADRGTGTFSVFIDSTSPVVTDSLLSQAQSTLNIIKAIGTTGYVTRPTYRGISMKVELMSKDGSDIVSDVDNELTPSLVNTINNLNRGDSLNPKELIRIILNDDRVLDADIADFSVGDYNITDNKLTNIELKVGGKQNLGPYEKWFGSSDLISYCMVENG
jgi:hypothetical protein